MQTAYSNDLDIMETKVRFCLDPSNPVILYDYLLLIETLISQKTTKAEKFCLAVRCTTIIYDSATDKKLPHYYRKFCFDMIEQPLGMMSKFADVAEHNKVLTDYRDKIFSLTISF